MARIKVLLGRIGGIAFVIPVDQMIGIVDGYTMHGKPFDMYLCQHTP